MPRALELLIADPLMRYTDIARSVGVDVATVRKWAGNKTFAQTLEDLKNERVYALSDDLVVAALDGIRALRDMALDTSVDAYVRKECATYLVEKAFSIPPTHRKPGSGPVQRPESVDTKELMEIYKSEIGEGIVVDIE